MWVAQLDAIGCDGLTYHLKMGQALLKRLARKYQGELLAAVAVSLTTTADLAQLAGDQAQHLIADIVAVGVVELLEVVNISHRDHITATQSLQAFIQGAAARQTRELIAKSHLIGLMRDSRYKHQHDQAAHHIQRIRQNEDIRQHPQHTAQP